MTTTAVVVPVKDGGELLAEVLTAISRERPDELLVIDSGSSDDSVRIARDAGATVIEIAPEDFSHGRTRNLAAQSVNAELVCFLTQDATPQTGWLQAYVDAFASSDRIGAAFGPHLPRADTSPMIARELTEFFAGFSPNGQVTLEPSGIDGSWHPGFLSNANSAYRRSILLEIEFRDVEYAEDQAFARDLLEAGYLKAYVPSAAALHAHDFPLAQFMKRYFDEYRGLNEAVGHVEAPAPIATARRVRDQVAGDAEWMRSNGFSSSKRARWLPRAAAHHGGRHLAAVLGSRAERLPAPVQSALSLENRNGSAGSGGGSDEAQPAVPTKRIEPKLDQNFFSSVRDLEANGPAELLAPVSGMSEVERLHVAIVIPPFKAGSGGHDTIFRIFRIIEQMGHSCSIWLADPMGRMASEWPAVVRRRIRDEFVELDAPVYKGFDDWFGADVALATGWETVYPLMQLPNCRARGYFVQDHEPEFFATSAESVWAADSYRMGLYTICASPWLAEMMRTQYDSPASVFQLGVDAGVYYPRSVPRRRDTIVFYGRSTTPRRAVAMGFLALDELHRRRPDVRILIYGDKKPSETSFPYEHVGVATQEQLALLYSEATVGLCLSVTNYSRAPQEMMACGLPCVDLAGFSAESVFGEDGPVSLSEFSVLAIADQMEMLIEDQALWDQRSLRGMEFAANHSWEAAAVEVEAGLREALRDRERLLPGASERS